MPLDLACELVWTMHLPSFFSYLACFTLKYPINLKSCIPSISFELNITQSNVLVVTSNIAIFCTNLSCNMTILCDFLSSILTITNHEISYIRDASIFMNLCSFCFHTICSLGKKGIDLFRKLKHDSHELMIPSNSNMFLIPVSLFKLSIY